MDENDFLVTLMLDDGTEIDCEPICIFNLNGRDYIALVPVDEESDEESEDVFIYRYVQNEAGGPMLTDIENDEELDAAIEELDRILEEEFGSDEDEDGDEHDRL